MGETTVCAICHENEPFVVSKVRDKLAEICAPCYGINLRARQRWTVRYACHECGQEQDRASDLRQILDVLEESNGMSPIKRICVPCRDDWWERVQDATYGYWSRRMARALDVVLAMLISRVVSRRGGPVYRRKAA
jgi:hypothetical protein